MNENQDTLVHFIAPPYSAFFEKGMIIFNVYNYFNCMLYQQTALD